MQIYLFFLFNKSWRCFVLLPPDGETDLLCQKCCQEDRDLGTAPLVRHYDQVQGGGGEGEDGQESLLHFTSEGVAETGGVGEVDDDHVYQVYSQDKLMFIKLVYLNL